MAAKKISGEVIISCYRDGLSAAEIAKLFGLSSAWPNSPRAKKLKRQAVRGKREIRQAPVTTYILPPDEIVRRYGRPGEQREKTPAYPW